MNEKQQLNNALIKLERAMKNDQVDPVSGYTVDDIRNWIEVGGDTQDVGLAILWQPHLDATLRRLEV